MKKFSSKNLEYNLSKTLKPIPKYTDSLKFGTIFTDHMIVCSWKRDKGWNHPSIIPFGKISVSPGSSTFHYGLQCFEGLKAYKMNDQILFFRPMMNMKRFRKSCERICLPMIDEKELLNVIGKLVQQEEKWIPKNMKGYSLYIRPVMIASNSKMDLTPVVPVDEAKLFCFLVPVGPYFPQGFKPVKLIVDVKNVRSFEGGCGSYKVGSNYGPSIYPLLIAQKEGYDQVLWVSLKGELQEVGTMNFFVVCKNDDDNGNVLITPPLSQDTILPGITRDSVIEFCKEWKIKVEERILTIDELQELINSHKVLEAFGSGTAAVICPIKLINYGGKDLQIPCPKDGLTIKLSDRIQDVQYGIIKHKYSISLDEILKE